MTETKDVLREFIAAPKPKWCKVTSTATMAALIVALEHAQEYCGHWEIAQRIGLSDEKAAMRAINLLVEHGWLTKIEGRPHNSYSVNVDKLPKGETNDNTR